MHDTYFLLVCVIVLATIFDFINGFHDTANAIATSVSTRVLTPRVAVTMAAILNLLGALTGTAVAKTVGAGLVESSKYHTTYGSFRTFVCNYMGSDHLVFWLANIIKPCPIGKHTRCGCSYCRNRGYNAERSI